MKKALIIGSTVVDVIVNLVDSLPKTGEDVHVRSQHMSLGGCAYNVSDSVRHFQVPYILFSPVGTGVYGYFVREELKKKGISSPIPSPNMDNGCCYCFVENSGERTFISYHGAEYLFQKDWFDLIDPEEIDSVYICGLEIDLINRIYNLSPILHLNETEALDASGKVTISEAGAYLYNKTRNTVIITLGEKGCYYFHGTTEEIVPPVPTIQADTIGAGDSHIGSVIACLKKGDSLHDAIAKANRVSSAVVATPSAILPDEEFDKLNF